MLINEIFYSLQGEGSLAGTPSAFIRLPGCNLRCKWCDTKYAWDPSDGTDYQTEQIKQQVLACQSNHLVITGGEPMTNPDLPELLSLFDKGDFHITVETSGIEFVADLPCSLMSISPKLSNAAPQRHLDIPTLQKLINNYHHQLKFVVDSPIDLEEINKCINSLRNVRPGSIYLMPQVAEPNEYIKKSQMTAELCKNTGYNFSPRLQVMLWDNKRGT